MRLAAILLFAAFLGDCRNSKAESFKGPQFTAGTRTEKTPDVTHWIFKGGLENGWQDHGWSNRLPRKPGEPERHQMAGYGGWILTKYKLTGTFGGVTFRYKADPPVSEFLELRVDSEQADTFPRVKLKPEHRRELPDGWSEVFVSMEELNPM
ncbi:MAG TPA: hypothetical protein VGE37_16485, partial [Archangium sp.]